MSRGIGFPLQPAGDSLLSTGQEVVEFMDRKSSDPTSPSVWPVQVPLHGSTMIWYTNHSSWLVLPSNLLHVCSVPLSRSLLKLLTLVLSSHCCFCKITEAGVPVNALEWMVLPSQCHRTVWATWIVERPPVSGLETASSMNSPEKQVRVKTKAWGLKGWKGNGWLHLSCWRTTKVTYSKRIRKLPRISRINWQWTNSQVFQLVFSLWTKVSGGMPDGCEWLWNLPYYLHFFCCSASEKEAGASKEDGCRALWA